SEAMGDEATAARAYGSIIDLYPARADLRRHAGARLARPVSAVPLAVATYAKTVASRPDHRSGHRVLGHGLLKAKRYREALEAIETGVSRMYPGGRFAGVGEVLREDLGLIAAAWLATDPGATVEVGAALARTNVALPRAPSTRFVLNWETDAN